MKDERTGASGAGFSASAYFHILTRMLSEPGRFFAEMPADQGLARPIGFLTVSAMAYSGARLMTGLHENALLMGGVFFVNAVGMTAIAAGLGYMIMVMAFGKRAAFRRVFGIYAFSAGTTLLTAWAPVFLIIAEPWKWLLIGAGMTRNVGLSKRGAFLIIGLSIAVMVLFFRSALPLLSR